ncbi:MAG: riboflavin synthase [Sphingomonadaceae bacterium]|nr:riboflavin synthase [Sphingomonadaceae bacterium]
MFTGIVSDIGEITAVEPRGDLRVTIRTGFDLSTVDIGASIACSGVCLTVVEKAADSFAVDVSGETVSRAAPGQWTVGLRLNLERALKVGDELGGHIVTGHVDGVGRVERAAAEGGSTHLSVAAPPSVAPYLAAKGSVTVDGVSLTVNAVEDRGDETLFHLNIIPHTAAVTTLGHLKAGDCVNLEIDILARYLSRMEAYRARR